MEKTILVLSILFLFICRYYYSKSNDAKNINLLLRQTARWLTASLSDNNPYIANLHANYGQGYIMALRSLYSEVKIRIVSGIDIRALEYEASKAQDRALKMLAVTCPEGAPKQKFLAKLAGQGI